MIPRFLPLKLNQKIAAEKSAQNEGSMRLTNGFAARSKTPLVSRSLRNIGTFSSNNDFKISPSINLKPSQVKNKNIETNLQTKKLTFTKFLKP